MACGYRLRWVLLLEVLRRVVDQPLVLEVLGAGSFRASEWSPSDSLASPQAEHLQSPNLAPHGQKEWSAVGAADSSHMGNIHL